MAARHRSPLRDHPRSRAIFIDAPVSSMKISRSGASPAWPSNQSRRRASTSGRRCSAAWPVFFCASARAWRRSARPSTGTPEPRATPPASRQSRPAIALVCATRARIKASCASSFEPGGWPPGGRARSSPSRASAGASGSPSLARHENAPRPPVQTDPQ